VVWGVADWTVLCGALLCGAVLWGAVLWEKKVSVECWRVSSGREGKDESDDATVSSGSDCADCNE